MGSGTDGSTGELSPVSWSSGTVLLPCMRVEKTACSVLTAALRGEMPVDADDGGVACSVAPVNARKAGVLLMCIQSCFDAAAASRRRSTLAGSMSECRVSLGDPAGEVSWRIPQPASQRSMRFFFCRQAKRVNVWPVRCAKGNFGLPGCGNLTDVLEDEGGRLDWPVGKDPHIRSSTGREMRPNASGMVIAATCSRRSRR